jgi:hypothetical protein
MITKFDYIIVGAGPSGLTLAYYLAKYNKKILLIEKEDTIGGDHRVIRHNKLFSEHSPRVYSSNYVNFINLLKDMNLNFYDLFVEYNYGAILPIKKVINLMQYNEYIGFIKEFFQYLINPNFSKNISVKEFCDKYYFSNEVINLLDGICRLTDGAEIERYTLFQFFELLNQNIFYKFYQPKYPNDVSLFKYWQENLKNVEILLNAHALYLNGLNGRIKNIVINRNNKIETYEANNIILAITPQSLSNIISKSNIDIQFLFNNKIYNKEALSQWANKTKYIDYISITFHWNQPLKLKKIWGGITPTDWGIAFVVQSDYTNFENPNSVTVISSIITKPDEKSKFLNRTVHECSKQEITKETFRQLKIIYPDIPDYTNSIMASNMYHKNNKWRQRDQAFVYTKEGYGPMNSTNYTNLYSLGCHSGHSYYNFTSMEAAVSNAIYLLNKIEPDSINEIKIQKIYTLKDLLCIIAIIFIIIVVYTIKNNCAI